MQSKNDPIRPTNEEDVKNLKSKYENWESYKVVMTRQILKSQKVKKLNSKRGSRGEV